MPILQEQSSPRQIPEIDPDLLIGDRIQPGHPLFGIIWINPERVSGAPCFFATRVPIQNLFDSITAGESLADFLDGFEGVTIEQARAVLSISKAALFAELQHA